MNLYKPAALISGFNLTDVVIEGEEMGHGYAEIDGKGEWWWAKFRRGPLPFGRPSLIQFMYSDHIILRKLILKNPPFWNTHFYASRDIVAELVRHCVISTGDDAIAIKSGLNEAGLRFGMPSSHIHLHDLEVRSKCLSIGSEMSGGISDVLVENIHFGDDRPKNRWHGIFIKSSRPRGGSVQNLLFRNITSVERFLETGEMFTSQRSERFPCPMVLGMGRREEVQVRLRSFGTSASGASAPNSLGLRSAEISFARNRCGRSTL
eukprot:g9706.t2